MTRTSPRLALLAAFAAVVVLAGCGSSSGDDASDSPTTTEAAPVTTTAPADTTTTTPPDDTGTTEAEAPAEGGDICVPLKVLSDFDAQSGTLINGSDWAATQQFFVDNTDEVLAAYDDAIAIGSEATEDLKELKGVTEITAEAAESSGDLMEFSSKLLEQPGIMEAGQAGITLNIFAETNCGFSTGGQNQ